MQYNVAIGRRQAHVAVRNSELKLMRERAVLNEQKKQVLHDLGSAVRQAEQSWRSAENNLNRLSAAQDVVEARLAAFESEAVTVDLLLEAVQRQVAGPRSV